MKPSYLRLVCQGKNDWWRYCLGFLFIEIFMYYLWLILAALMIRQLYDLDIISRNWSYDLFVVSRAMSYFRFLGVYVVLKWFHKRSFSTVVSISGKFSLRRMLVAGGILSLLLFVVLSEPTFTLDSFELKNKIWFPLIALSTIIQAAGEEFIYRGYIMQGLNLINPRPMFAIVFSSLLFAGSHYMYYLYSIPTSLEKMVHFPFFFIAGVICAVITIKDNRIERAIGLHAAWNMMQILAKGI